MDAGHHQRTEVVALAGLIGSDGASRCPVLRPFPPPPASAIHRFPLPCTNELIRFQMGRSPPGSPVDQRRGGGRPPAPHRHPAGPPREAPPRAKQAPGGGELTIHAPGWRGGPPPSRS